jgi:hypothetical protein
MRSIVFVVISTVFALVSPAVLAQPAVESDRAAARNLYFEGMDLQKAGKFAEALDRFTRANAVINAPTNVLRIAECQASLGHLVESVEAYRSIQRLALPPDAPRAFVQAVNQGNAEIGAVEARVPELTIEVRPAQIPALTVTVDGQPINLATLGSSRPINPGSHVVRASAPGYTAAEGRIEMAEKERRTLALDLENSGAVVNGPLADKPPPFQSKEAPPEHRSRTSIYFGPRLGVSKPGASFPPSVFGATRMNDVAGAGPTFGVEGALRFVRLMYVSALVDVNFSGERTYRVGGSSESNPPFVTTTQRNVLLGGRLGLISNPDGVAIMGDVGLGYRTLTVTGTIGGGPEQSVTVNGVEGSVGVGLHFKIGDSLRLVPRAELAAGTFEGDRSAGSPSAGGGLTSGKESPQHTFLFFGVAGYFDINLDRRPSARAAM